MLKPGHFIPNIRSKPGQIIDTDTIPGWSSYRFHQSSYLPTHAGINRQYFTYSSLVSTPTVRPYENVIKSGLENILIWEPRALIGLIIALVVSIVYWITKIL